MKIKNLLFVAVALAGSITVSAQSNLLNAKTPDEIGKKTAAQMISDNDKPLPYGYVHDRDVLMGKTIWEFVDIDEVGIIEEYIDKNHVIPFFNELSE